jgi:hypothetical protein
MPRRQSGVPNWQLLSAKTVFEFRLERHKEMSKVKAVDKKGKKRARKHQEEPQPEASGSGPSPSTSLMPLREMTLESGSAKGSSPVLEHAGSLPTLFSVEIPIAAAVRPTRIIVPLFQKHQQLSPSGLSQSTDDGRNLTARVAALEARMDKFEEWTTENARWKKQVEGRLAYADI